MSVCHLLLDLYAYYEVHKRLTDMKLHQMIDKINPDLRSIDNVNGKKRVREFYNMSKEDALANEIEDTNSFYAEAYHLNKTSNLIKEVCSKLKTEVLKLGDFAIEPKKLYIPFKINNTNVFDVSFLKYKLKIFINLPKGELVDEKEYCRDISNLGHWGNDDYELIIQKKFLMF